MHGPSLNVNGEIRSKIFLLLHKGKRLTQAKIRRKLRLEYDVLKYHLRRMQKEGLILCDPYPSERGSVWFLQSVLTESNFESIVSVFEGIITELSIDLNDMQAENRTICHKNVLEVLLESVFNAVTGDFQPPEG